MKSLLSLLLFLSLPVLAQQRAILKIDSLPASGILLDKGWKFHAGDNPDFAKIDFDDLKWEDIDPTKDIFDLSQISKDGKIGWFRLDFSLAKVPTQPLSIMLQQSGASEIYLNGKLIAKYGKLSNIVVAYDPLNNPIYLPIDSAGQFCLTFRYALQPNIHYTKVYGNSKNEAFLATLIPFKNAIDVDRQYKIRYTNLESYKLGLFFILFVLHISFYLFYRVQKVHLFVAISFLSLGLDYSFKLLADLENLVEQRHFYYIVSYMLSILTPFLTLNVLYLFLNQRRRIIYWSLGILTFISCILSFRLFDLGIPGFILSILIAIEQIRVVWRGIQAKVKGAWVLAIGVAINVFFFIFLFSIIGFFMSVSPVLADIVFNTALLAFPVSLSVFLGVTSAYTNRELTKKLIENEKLSAEKQQILASQNETLEKQVNERTAELKASQNQLIQKEKLASLGELTAGIAHEIQNPLNFVNNFSEMSVELIQELIEEENKPLNTQDSLLKTELLNDLSANQVKINHHGKRASSIVSNMLEHSRTSTGERAMTDINKLADEYLRLSYHGMRAKYKNFNADYEIITDENLPLINVVPQDIGRVLLNLINNAFYAVSQPNLQGFKNLTGLNNAKVIVKTEHSGNQLIIKVIDNGTGMSKEVHEKIFQPFFTTKPTGEGTGLGLSLAYDIITKGHGGTIEVDSVEGEGTTFIVKLPYQ